MLHVASQGRESRPPPAPQDVPAREEREADDPARVPQHVEAEALPAQGQPRPLQLVAVDAARGAEAQRPLERGDEAGQAGGGGDVARGEHLGEDLGLVPPLEELRRARPQAVRGRDELAALDRLAQRAQELALEAELADERPRLLARRAAPPRGPARPASGLEPRQEARRRRDAEAVPVGRLAGPRDLALPLRAALDAQEDPLPVAGEELAEREDAPLRERLGPRLGDPLPGLGRRGSGSRSSSPRP